MSRFVKTLALFVAGLQLVPSKACETLASAPGISGDDDLKGVTLQPLNGKFDNLFAGHSSHSSHRSHSSHSSHYSGSSGTSSGYVAPAAPYIPATPARPPVQPVGATADESAPSAAAVPENAHPRAAASSNSSGSSVSVKKTIATPGGGGGDDALKPEVPMTRAEKLHLQIFRVQIRLNSLGLYNGVMTGTLDAETSTALKHFQRVKSLPESGQMTTATLNALAIPAVK